MQANVNDGRLFAFIFAGDLVDGFSAGVGVRYAFEKLSAGSSAI